jgi:hypothetical protein
MAKVYVHYAVDRGGITYLHFSGSQSLPFQPIRDSAIFALAVSVVKQIPHLKRAWNETAKTWEIDSEFWAVKREFYVLGEPSGNFKLVAYTVEDFENWRDGVTQAKPDFKSMPENKAAQGFFNNFNQVIEKVAVAKSDREMLVELLGFSSWVELDRTDRITLRKRYKQAAMKLHPDRNNGDGSKMATLNQLWGAYVNH